MFNNDMLNNRGSQVALIVKNLPANARHSRDMGSILEGKILWRRAWQPSLVFMPGESHGQRIWQAIVHWVTELDTIEVT